MNALVKYQQATLRPVVEDYDPDFAAEVQAEILKDFQPTIFTAKDMKFTNKKTGEQFDTLRGVILAVSTPRFYWPEKDGEKIPFCSSGDSLTGSWNRNAAPSTWDAAMQVEKRFAHPAIAMTAKGELIPDTFNCVSCPLAQWGSAHQKKNRAGAGCQERRFLLMQLEGWFTPAIVSLAITSIKHWKSYVSTLTSQYGKTWAEVITELSLIQATNQERTKYTEVVFSAVSALPKQVTLSEVKPLREQFKSLIHTSTVLENVEYYMSDEQPAEQPINHSATNGGQDIPF